DQPQERRRPDGLCQDREGRVQDQAPLVGDSEAVDPTRPHLAGTSTGGSLAFWRGFFSSGLASFSIAANASDMCSVRPSQGSICTSALAPASACVDFVCDLCGVSWFRQPPRSTDLPASPIGS